MVGRDIRDIRTIHELKTIQNISPCGDKAKLSLTYQMLPFEKLFNQLIMTD